MLAIIVFLIAEYIGDFLLQPRWMALNKSKDGLVLARHGLMIYIPLFAGMTFLAIFKICTLGEAAAFSLIYTCLHCFQDWWLWLGYSWIRSNQVGLPEFKYYEDKLFYDFIGLDRLLHVSIGIALLKLMLH